MAKVSRIILIFILFVAFGKFSSSQVNSVKFGKNRTQYKKQKWQFYQSPNFNVYFNEGGLELAKFVVQAAENQLEQMEAAAEYSLQRRANIILYNNFTDFQQTNIGLETDIINSAGVTKFVNNKMVIYFNSNHANLNKQIRNGIATILTQNVLFGEDVGEVAGNQTLLDLPEWFTNGYISYLGENWSTDLDDEMRSEMLSGDYTKFSKFVFQKPSLAGHAFWYFIEEKYKKENVTYFLYLARTLRSTNKASLQITKLKFNDLLKDFMEYNEDKYSKDLMRRKPYPKGNVIDGFTISKRLNYYRFNVNPNKKNNSYVVTQYKNGIIRVILNDDYENKTLLKYGTRTLENAIHPQYPMMAWSAKGSHIAIIYALEGKLRMFIYDVNNDKKQSYTDLSQTFDQVQDVKYMSDNNTLLLSAVKNGHTDIYTLDIRTGKAKQITNDVYDNLDATFVAFPNKTGIIYASNRPSADATTSDTVLPSLNRFNIFLITNFGDKPELNQITQLTDLKYGNARYPMQYNVNHFTFVSDENGIKNRYAGFFTSKKEGLDTMVLINDEILRNPSQQEIDSTLTANNKQEIDSIAIISISSDSAYSFPLTNYPSNLAETRIAGDNNQVSEVTRQSDEKILYKLKIDDQTLYKRNVTARPTAYMEKIMLESRRSNDGKNITSPPAVENKKPDNVFQSEFERDSATSVQPQIIDQSLGFKLSDAKLFRYKPLKFSADFGSLSLSSSVLVNRYQPYAGGSGPVRLSSETPLNGLITLGTTELLEDLKISGGFRLSTNLKDNEWLMSFQNFRRRIDWGLTYYRNVQGTGIQITDQAGNPIGNPYPGKIKTNLYQVNASYPFDETKRVGLTTGLRADRILVSAVDQLSAIVEDSKKLYSVSSAEFVYDNTLNPAMNIMDGFRAKVFFDYYKLVSKTTLTEKPSTFNAGFDARYYYPIYRNFIWAGRAAGDFSFGNQKMIYYLGGVDGWLMFGDNGKYDKNGNLIKERFFNSGNTPDQSQNYAFQSLAVNMRGFIQNVANGNNALVINSEFRLPVVSTLFDKQVNNAFLNNFQLVQFFDLGTAWSGDIKNIKRPEMVYGSDPVSVKVKAGGLGPFAGGYGFGARSTLLGYFIKFDAGWQMNGFFKGKPVLYLALGLDF